MIDWPYNQRHFLRKHTGEAPAPGPAYRGWGYDLLAALFTAAAITCCWEVLSWAFN